jgi:predicted nucleotidyltransferase
MGHGQHADLDARDRAQIDQIIEVTQTTLGPEAEAAYLSGSAVDGGLRPDSDIDVLVVSRRPATPAEKRQIIDLLLPISGRHAALGPARSIELTIVVGSEVRPWRYPPLLDLQYGDWLRPEFERGGDRRDAAQARRRRVGFHALAQAASLGHRSRPRDLPRRRGGALGRPPAARSPPHGVRRAPDPGPCQGWIRSLTGRHRHRLKPAAAEQLLLLVGGLRLLRLLRRLRLLVHPYPPRCRPTAVGRGPAKPTARLKPRTGATVDSGQVRLHHARIAAL